MSLSVGLDLYFATAAGGGAVTYARELVPELLELEPGLRLTAFVPEGAPDVLVAAPWAGSVEWVHLPGPRPWPRGLPRTLALRWGAIPALSARRRIDLLHGPGNVVAPLAPGARRVVSALDVIWEHVPDALGVWGTREMRLLVRSGARRAHRVIAISEATKRDLTSWYGVDPGKVDVVPLGVRPEPEIAPAPDVRARLAVPPGPLVACVAQKRAHKNLAVLVRAFAQLPHQDAQLVLPGAPTGYEAELRDLASELGVAARVHFPAWLEEAELEGLYAAADCFVLPSLIEGFGLPVLEAMRAGTPVVCSDASALPEVAGDAALLCDPHDPADIARQIGRVLSEPGLAQDLRERGRARVRELTWRRTAELTLASYGRALSA